LTPILKIDIIEASLKISIIFFRRTPVDGGGAKIFMKKTLIGPILTVLAMLLLAGMFIYFYVSLNRLDKKLIAVQTAIADDSGKISAIVNFFNANANGQTNQK